MFHGLPTAIFQPMAPQCISVNTKIALLPILQHVCCHESRPSAWAWIETPLIGGSANSLWERPASSYCPGAAWRSMFLMDLGPVSLFAFLVFQLLQGFHHAADQVALSRSASPGADLHSGWYREGKGSPRLPGYAFSPEPIVICIDCILSRRERPYYHNLGIYTGLLRLVPTFLFQIPVYTGQTAK